MIGKIIVIGQMDNKVDNTLESANRVYSSQGIAPTIPICASDKTPKFLINTTKVVRTISKTEKNITNCSVIGCMDNTVDHTFESANRVYDSRALAPTIPTCAGGNIQPKVMVRLHGQKNHCGRKHEKE